MTGRSYNKQGEKDVWVRQGARKKYQDQLEEMAKTWQIGVYKRLSDQYQIVVPTTNEDNAMIIVAAITNWVFRFGDYGPKVAANPALKLNVDAALPNCARALRNEDDLSEITLAVIIAAAAQNTPMPMFTTHFDTLAALGIVKRNINLYVPKATGQFTSTSSCGISTGSTTATCSME